MKGLFGLVAVGAIGYFIGFYEMKHKALMVILGEIEKRNLSK